MPVCEKMMTMKVKVKYSFGYFSQKQLNTVASSEAEGNKSKEMDY